MGRENLETVRRMVAAWSRGDLDEFIAFFDPRCEAVFRPDVPEPGPFRGRAELRQWADGFRSAWASHRAEIADAEAAGDHVFALLRMVGLSTGSHIRTEDTWPFVFRFRGGLIDRWQGFAGAGEARKAAGLVDQS
jgi:ketosteroid isomerase-like protein